MNRVSAPGALSIDRLQVLLQSRSITASKVYHQTHTITASKFIRWWPPASPNTLNRGLEVHLWVHSISASKCISKLARSRPPSVSPNSLNYAIHVRMIMASKFIAKLARSRPPECISKYAWLLPPSAYSISLDHGLAVYLWVHWIVIFRCTSNCSQSPPAASPDILCVDG